MTTFWLSTHLEYACRHSGACCTARWPIPVERARADAVAALVGAGLAPAPASWLRAAPGAPADVAGVLALQPSGRCVFYGRRTQTDGAGGCSIHAVRPASCEHFPYVTVTDARGTHVTLSHFCPTAADLLFEERPVAVVEGPALFADGRLPEGLDAREALPPLDGNGRSGLRPRLMAWDDVTRWERQCIASLASGPAVETEPVLEAFAAARAATTAEWGWPDAPEDTLPGWHRWVAPSWPRWAAVTGRYLAAKVHGSWAMCLGSGPPDVERAVAIARSVLQVEAVRICTAKRTRLDRATLHGAIRQADLLLVHHAVPERLYPGEPRRHRYR